MTRNQYAGPIAVLLLFGWFGWPTLYATRTTGSDTVRVNRITGCMDASTLGGWQRLSNSSESCMTPELRLQKAAEAAQEARFRPAYQAGKQLLLQALRSNASGELVLGVYAVELYNPTQCKLSSITINLGGRTYTEPTYTKGGGNASSTVNFIVYDGQGANTTDWDFADVEYETPDHSLVSGVPACMSNLSATGG